MQLDKRGLNKIRYYQGKNHFSIWIIGSYLLISARLASEAVMVALVDAAKITEFNNFIFCYLFFFIFEDFLMEILKSAWFYTGGSAS